MRIGVETVTVHPRRVFRIARGSSDSFERVILSLEVEGVVGRGEAAPTAYHEGTAADAHAALESVRVEDPWDIEGTLQANGYLPQSTLCALDAALHDLAARHLGVPVYRLLGLARPAPVSAYTLGISDLETTAGEARRLSDYPILKVKVGGAQDFEAVRTVLAETGAEVWVDANGAFAPGEAIEAALELKAMGVAMIEQPVPAAAGAEALRRVTEAVKPLPVIADESAARAADVPALSGCVSGVNIKLAKCGGIRGALAMAHAARAHGMRLMLGCMVETSLGIAAAVHISGLFDMFDLDGAMLLTDDPFAGLAYEKGLIRLPEAPGLGVEWGEDVGD